MKRYFVLGLLMLPGFGGMAQTLTDLQAESSPYELKTEIINEGTYNAAGGLSRGANFNGLTAVSLGINLEKAGLWKGAFFYAKGIAAYGGTPSSKQIGDIQPISRIETANRISLFECWFSQKLGAAELLLGQHDMNTAFGANSLSGAMINTSFGIFPSVALQTPLSIYPAPATAAKLKLALGKEWAWQAALYDGRPLAQSENPHNIKRDWKLLDALFSITEIAYTREKAQAEKSTYKLGAFYHHAGGTSVVDPGMEEKTLGVYTTIEQHLLSTGDKQLAAFFQAGGTSGNQNMVDAYASGGLTVKGLQPAWSDALTLGLVYSSLNNELLAQHESHRTGYRALLELTYKAKINEHFSIQPDLQYIINPGAQQHAANVFAGLLRFSILY